MSTFSFNKLYIIESLPSSEFQIGTELGKRINNWVVVNGINCQAETFQVHSIQEWEIVWNEIYTSIEKMDNLPIIHLEMFGNNTSIGIDRGKNGMILLEDVFKKIQQANVLSHNNVFLSLAVCMGLNMIRSLKVYAPMPFCGVLGSQDSLNNDELLENYMVFFTAFLSTFNLDKVVLQMQEAGIDTGKYELFKPEQIFMNAYLSYLESYRTDEQIVEKAFAAAKSAGVVFHNKEEETRFLRNYRCRLLMTENVEYQRARNEFFMFNRFPEIESRFKIPPTIREFKKYAIENGHSWLQCEREITVEDIKGISLTILKKVDVFCKEHDIRYSLAYGSLLGAVRHKGFIPWDDDIDIMMLRPDYEKFVHSFNGYERDFCVFAPEHDLNYYAPYANICYQNTILRESEDAHRGLEMGVKIDLFPIDAVQMKRFFRIKQRIYYGMWFVYRYKRHFIERDKVIQNMIVWVMAKILGYKRVMKCYLKFAKLGNLKETKMVDNVVFPIYKNKELSLTLYDQYKDIEFEGYRFKAIVKYDEYLKRQYGNYMQLPPIEKRVSHHAFAGCWK